MKDLWKHHLKYYDFFQNKVDGYVATLKIHLRELKDYKNILDTGAGSGNLTVKLLEQNHIVTAIDTDKSSLSLLSKKCEKFRENLKVQEMDAQNLDFEDATFDGASSMFVIPFVKNKEKYLKEVYRVLRSKSKFTVSAWAPESGEVLMEIISKELSQKGILSKYRKEWDHIQESSRINSQIVKKGPRGGEIVKILEEIGFNQVRVLNDKPYGIFSYFIVCEK